FLTIGRNHTIHTGKDRSEEVGNNRRDKTVANHWVEIGGHREERIAGNLNVEAGQAIEHKTQRYELSASTIVLRAPGGSITLDGSGITLDASAIQLKGSVSQSGGAGGSVVIPQGIPEKGLPFDLLCMKQADGSCPLPNCRCGNYRGGR